ncbi:MAG: DUF5615 family PIN-like protein [Planctomycetaceae bacterium]|nr:DUF5615 family PIN-like protein [Planctomycetaceae bacterium]
MRFLIDNQLSPKLALALTSLGHDAVHVKSLGLADASDERIFDLAAKEERVVVAADTDFGTLLAARRSVRPSVVLFRVPNSYRTEARLRLLLDHLPSLEPHLRSGCIAVFSHERLRVRALPILP